MSNEQAKISKGISLEEQQDYNKERVQQSLSLIQHLVESLMKGKKITLPGIQHIPWESCTLFSNTKTETSPGKDREETEAITHAKRASNSKYKTQPCKWFHSGLGCERGDNCDYIHDFNYKGVMPPPHTYKSKKSQLISTRQHIGSNQMNGVTSSQTLSSSQAQPSNSQQQVLVKTSPHSSTKVTSVENNQNSATSLSPNNRNYGVRTGSSMQGDKDIRSDYRQNKESSYRYRGYMNDDYRRQQHMYRNDEEMEDGQGKKSNRQYSEDARRPANIERTHENEEEAETTQAHHMEEKESEKKESGPQDESEKMNEEEVQKEAQKDEEGIDTKESQELEEGQVQREYEHKFYNNYNQRMRRNFDNREYYNSNFRRDYHHKRSYSDPYYEDYDNDGEYIDQGYNGYYNDRGYYGNSYYYGRNRNYRQGYYDQGWGRGKGGWRNNGYRYDDYDEEYYDDENHTSQGQNSHLPDNPYDEEGQEENENQSYREEGEARDENPQEQQGEDADPELQGKAKDSEKEDGLREESEGAKSKQETTKPASSGETKISSEAGESHQAEKDAESQEDGEVNRKGKHRKDHHKRERGERGEREGFSRNERGDKFNNTGRYGPYGGKGRYNKNFNYNQQFFGSQGDAMQMQMMYNMPFMNMMNNSFDLSTMMHFANNFQNYAQNQKQNYLQGYEYDKQFSGEQNRGYSDNYYGRRNYYNSHNVPQNGQNPDQPAKAEAEDGAQVDEQQAIEPISHEILPEVPQNVPPQQEKEVESIKPQKIMTKATSEAKEKSSSKNHEGSQSKQSGSHTKRDPEKVKQGEERAEDAGEEDEEDGNEFGEEEQKDDDKNDTSFQDEQNDEENYEDPGFYQYNDYRYRNNRDYDHKSAHYHQQQRMKFFNQQFIETLKKYPPDVFKCTFPQFFGMSGNPNSPQGGPQVPNNFNGIPSLSFMSYMMNQMLNQNMAAAGGQQNFYQPPYHSQGHVYQNTQSHPSGFQSNQSELPPINQTSVQSMIQEDVSQPQMMNNLKHYDHHIGQADAHRPGDHAQDIFLNPYDPQIQGQANISQAGYQLSPQQNLIADMMTFHNLNYPQEGLPSHSKDSVMHYSQTSQTKESSKIMREEAVHGDQHDYVPKSDQRIDINAMLTEDNHSPSLVNEAKPIGQRREAYEPFLDHNPEDKEYIDNSEEYSKPPRQEKYSHHIASEVNHKSAIHQETPELRRDVPEYTSPNRYFDTVEKERYNMTPQESSAINPEMSTPQQESAPIESNVENQQFREQNIHDEQKPQLRRSARKKGKK